MVVLCVVLRYAMIQAAGGGVERRKRSQGDGGGYDGSERTGGETDEAIAVYTYGHSARARNINSTRQGAPNLLERGRISRPLGKRERQ